MRHRSRGAMLMRMIWCFLGLFFFSGIVAGQDLLWDVVEDFGGYDVPGGITLSTNGAIVVGNTGAPGVDFVMQSLGRTDGSEQWTEFVPGQATQIASSLGRVFTAGSSVDAAGPNSNPIGVWAYEALTGTLLWRDVWDAGPNDIARTIAAAPSAVVVAGTVGNDATDFIVRAYDPISGAVLWDDQVERADQDMGALTVAIDRNRVFVAGTIRQDSGPAALLVRAYHAASGALVWETMRLATTPAQIEASAGRVFVAGTSTPSPARSYVGAFDAQTGALLWEEEETDVSGFADIAADRHRVVAAGRMGEASHGWLVRVYDAPSGHLEWEHQTVMEPGYFEGANAVALNERAVYVAGGSHYDPLLGGRYHEMLVRAYDAVAGTLLWDDRSHRAAAAGGAVDVALGTHRLFVLGLTANQGPFQDFVIRAYDIQTDLPAPRTARVSRSE